MEELDVSVVGALVRTNGTEILVRKESDGRAVVLLLVRGKEVDDNERWSRPGALSSSS